MLPNMLQSPPQGMIHCIPRFPQPNTSVAFVVFPSSLPKTGLAQPQPASPSFAPLLLLFTLHTPTLPSFPPSSNVTMLFVLRTSQADKVEWRRKME